MKINTLLLAITALGLTTAAMAQSSSASSRPQARRDCLAPDSPMRVDRLPGTPATTGRPRNPLANELPHCIDDGEPLPATRPPGRQRHRTRD